VEQRINQITKQKSDAEAALGAQTQANEALVQKLQNLEQKLESLTSKDASSDPVAALLSSEPAKKTQTLSPNDIAQLVQSSVQQAIAPIAEQVQTNREQQQLAAQQRASFEKAAASEPGLNEDGPLWDAFQQIWDGRPDLQSLPDAPQLVATMAKGVLSDARVAEKRTDERKVAANIQKPALSGSSLDGINENARAQELYDEMYKKAAITGLTPDEEVQFFKLAQMTATSKRK